MEWFKMGGWGMYPILVVGLVCLGTSAFYAARGDGRVRGSIEALSRALSWFIATAVATDLITVCFFLSSDKGPPPEMMTRIFFQGLGESLTPLAMGGSLLSLSWLFTAVGQRRADQRV